MDLASFAQPVAVFGAGVCALLAGLLALIGAHWVSSRSHASTIIDVEHRDKAARVEQLRKRYEWVVSAATRLDLDQNAAIDAVQAAQMAVSIRDAAASEDSKDTHLHSMLDVYLGDQLGGLAAEVGLPMTEKAQPPDNETEARVTT